MKQTETLADVADRVGIDIDPAEEAALEAVAVRNTRGTETPVGDDSAQIRRELQASIARAVRARGWRRRKRATQLARLADISRDTASRLLSCESRPQVQTLVRVARALGVKSRALDNTAALAGLRTRASARVGVRLKSNSVDLHAARHAVRCLAEPGVRLPHSVRRLVSDIAASLGLPDEWEALPLADFEA